MKKMKKIGLLFFFMASVSLLSLTSCKKDEDDADKFAGTWTNVTDATDIIYITKVNANTISVNGMISLNVIGNTFSGIQTDLAGFVTTISGVLNGSIVTVTAIEKDMQGNITNSDIVQYRKM